MNIQGLLLLLISIPNFVLGVIILARNSKNRSNLFFALFALVVGAWSLGLAGYIFSNSLDNARYWAQGYYIAATYIAAVFLYFSFSFVPAYVQQAKVVRFLPIIIATVLATTIAFYPSFIIAEVARRPWGKEVLLDDFGYTIFTIYFCLYVAMGFIAILTQLLKSTRSRRIYLRLIFSGLIVAFSAGAFFNLFLPAIGNYEYIWAGPLFTLVYVCTVSYAIIKHHLFDIKSTVGRAIGYIGSIATILIVYSVAIAALTSTDVLSSNLSTFQRYAYAFAVVLTGLLFAPLKRFFDRTTNRFFYRNSYDAQGLLDELNKTLVADVEVESILDKTAKIIESNLKASYCGFYIRETAYFPSRFVANYNQKIPENQLEKIRQLTPQIRHKIHSTALEPGNSEEKILNEVLNSNQVEILGRLVSTLKYEVAGVGYMLIGAKRSGEEYSSQDLKVLEIITNELVLAVENALRLEEIEQFNVTLQKKIDDATKELKASNEKLKALDEAKDEFVSMASHQLRTPLTSIKGYLSMVIEGDAGTITDTQKDMLGQAFFSSQRMVYLISDLLNVSRLKTGKFLIEPISVYLPDVVASEIDQLRDGAKVRNLTISYVKPDTFSTVMLDEMKIRQVIMNFIDNAIYYTPSGGTINVGLKETKKTIEFTVTDSGIGVPKEQQHKLFTKFYRAENARKTRPDGTGLGLFMAKKVIIAQGGSVIFTSKEGKGSTFGFSFPKEKLLAQDNTKP